jgi:FkbM family methyltransferase
MRVEVLERLSSESIVDTAISCGTLSFFAPSPLLRTRADTILTKEPDTIRWIEGFPAASVLWDIGANVGVFSLYAARRARCRVVSFEPSAANFFVLVRNVQVNGLEDTIATYCLALAGSTQLGVLNLASASMGTAMSHFGEAGDISRYAVGGTDSEKTAHGMIGFTIDEFIARFAPPFPTHIKIDVDGLELAILQGATNTLKNDRLRSVMVELTLTHDDERQRAIALLSASGLNFTSRGPEQRAGNEGAANHLFVRA